MSDNLYYLRNKEQRFLGNAPTFWGKEGGYTAYVQGAQKFTAADALDKVNCSPEKFEAIKCADIDCRLHYVFDWQDANSLGTNKPCGWEFGYAPPPPVEPVVPLSEVLELLGHIHSEWVYPKGGAITKIVQESTDSVFEVIQNKLKQKYGVSE